MGRETRIGLLVSLGFVVVFGLVLAELTGLDPAGPAAAPSAAVTGTDYSHAYPIEELRVSERPAPRRAVGHSAERPSSSQRRAAVVQQQTNPQPPRPVAEAPRPLNRQYTVVPSDTLIGIARKVYGRAHGNEYRRILDANRSLLAGETSLKPGQTLVIPALPGAAPARAQEATDRLAPAPVAHVAASQAPVAAITRETSAPPAGWVYIFNGNETLQKIAWTYYNDDSGAAVQRIINANPGLETLSRYPAGMKIVIPPAR
ncbi:MAG: LysM peptidoglycan-binding domain-containing protein [Planctomycetaceae bacterium]|nr:LysM peptidoglycan-binding domain-containing protein [Planctomycetaceae bacterium]